MVAIKMEMPKSCLECPYFDDYCAFIRNLKYTMEKYKNDTVGTFGTNISVMCKDILDYLEQEPKTGHWIVEVWNNKEHHTCSSCQHVVDYEPCYHYCPYCGAKMVEPQESEDKDADNN